MLYADTVPQRRIDAGGETTRARDRQYAGDANSATEGSKRHPGECIQWQHA
jgi:hypothetical protein